MLLKFVDRREIPSVELAFGERVAQEKASTLTGKDITRQGFDIPLLLHQFR